MKAYNKYGILIIISCILTILTQLIYHSTPQGDSLCYVQLAKQYTSFNFFEPSLANSQEGGHPAYIIFLALFGSPFSYNQYVIGVIQTIIFCLSLFSLTRELERYLNKNLTGLLIIILLTPEMHFFNGSILTESLQYSLLLFIFSIALGIYQRGAKFSNLLLLSLLLGISILIRSESVACIITVLFLIYPKIKEKFIFQMLIILSFPAFLLFLNGVKNYETFHIFRVTAFNEGEALYGGNNENLDGSPHIFEMHKNIFLPANKIAVFDSIFAMPPLYSIPKRDSFYHQLAIEAWKKNPVQQLGVIPEKLAKNWLLPGMFDIYTNDTTKKRGLQLGKLLSKQYFNNAWYAPYKHLLYIILHWILLSLIIAGLYRIKKQNRFQISVVLLLLFYLLYTIPFCGLPRFHVAIFPLLLIAFIPLPVVLKVSQLILKRKNKTGKSE